MMSSESNNEDSSSEEFELEDSQLNSSGSGIKVNQRSIRKANQNNGDSYVNTSGNFVRSKSFQAVSKCCPKKCYEKVEIRFNYLMRFMIVVRKWNKMFT